jgi:hypothetical protein
MGKKRTKPKPGRGRYIAAMLIAMVIGFIVTGCARGEEPSAIEEPLRFGISANFDKAQEEIKRAHEFCLHSGGCTILSRQDALNLQSTFGTLKAQIVGLERRIAYCEERNFHSIRIVPVRLYVNDGVRGPNDFGERR